MTIQLGGGEEVKLYPCCSKEEWDLARISNLLQITQQIKKQTASIGNVWKDEQFQRFNQDFNENIFKPVMKATNLMENEAHYIEKTVELQREIQKLKIR